MCREARGGTQGCGGDCPARGLGMGSVFALERVWAYQRGGALCKIAIWPRGLSIFEFAQLRRARACSMRLYWYKASGDVQRCDSMGGRWGNEKAVDADGGFALSRRGRRGLSLDRQGINGVGSIASSGLRVCGWRRLGLLEADVVVLAESNRRMTEVVLGRRTRRLTWTRRERAQRMTSHRPRRWPRK